MPDLNRCGSCVHYEPNAEPEWEIDPEIEGEDRADDLTEWGSCLLARRGYDAFTMQGEAGRLPTAREAAAIRFFPSDGERWTAWLNVRPDFGCILWAEKAD